MQVLTDAQWAKFAAGIAAAEIRGARPRKEDRRTIEAIIWRLDNGAKWRSIPAEFGNWHHAYLRFRRWTLAGVWDKIMAYVVAQGEPSPELSARPARRRPISLLDPHHVPLAAQELRRSTTAAPSCATPSTQNPNCWRNDQIKSGPAISPN